MESYKITCGSGPLRCMAVTSLYLFIYLDSMLYIYVNYIQIVNIVKTCGSGPLLCMAVTSLYLFIYLDR
jgi:hypothetical protein